MARKTSDKKPKPVAVRKAEEAQFSLNLNTLIFRGVIGLLLLGGILLLTQPRFLGWVETHRDAGNYGGISNGNAQLSDAFTSEVLYWRDDIIRWGQERNLNPN